MSELFEAQNLRTKEGAPDGGRAWGTGLVINWQRGPLLVDGERRTPNGAFVETVIRVALQRLEFYQDSTFACDENAEAIAHLKSAIQAIEARTARRTAAAIEGTHQGH